VFEDIIKEKKKETYEIIQGADPTYLLSIYNQEGPIVTIDYDGTVTMHQHGKEKEAAEIFWEAMADHFKGHYKKI
jgi:ArsR family metal-binding transcriptional regulator